MKKFITRIICIAFITALCAGNLTAQETYTITLSANSPQCGTVSGSVTDIPEGTFWMVVATPSSLCMFINWTENGVEVSVEPQYEFIITEDRDLVANFFPVDYYNIILLSNPIAGGTVTGGGVYKQGIEVIVVATPSKPYFDFINWTDENGIEIATDSILTFIVTEDRVLAANFGITTTPFEIIVSANPQEYGTVSGGGFFTFGTTVTATAEAYPGFLFLNWTENGKIISTEANYLFEVYESRNLIANFVSINCEITVSANPPEYGTVSGGGVYAYGEQVFVSATAHSDYEFVNWTEYGEVVSTTPEHAFIALGQRSLYANFAKSEKVEVVVLTNMPGGEILGGGTYKYGDEVTVEAIPNLGYKFVNWTEGRGVVSTENPYSFIVTESMLLIANFEENGMMNIESIDAEGIFIYPNPTTGELRVESGALRVERVEVFDVTGKKISNLTSQISNPISINISDFPAGVYFIQIQTVQGTVTKKFVKN
jgi:hypothetical protein